MIEPIFDESLYAELDGESPSWPRITPPSSTTVSAFVSHTSVNAQQCKNWVLPAIEHAVSGKIFLNYDTFKNPLFREAYARNILVNLRCSEHLVIVLSEAAMSSAWMKEEVSWWLRRRGSEDVTVVALDTTTKVLLHPQLADVPAVDFSRWPWLAGWQLTRRLKKELASSGWLVVRRWPRRVHRSML